MLFNSLEFLIFFPIVTALYFFLPHRFRWFVLLTASCLFYMHFIPKYILVLFLTIAIDYAAGIWIEKSEGTTRKWILAGSILSTCLVLFFFKYFNFFNSNLETLARFIHWQYPVKTLEIILPIGLSFHTFQSLSYVIEVYRRQQKAERHFGIYALYVMFYPQLVAGPIERPQNLLHQFTEKHTFEYQRAANGLKLMAWGMFKKVVIADRLAAFVGAVYGSPEGWPGISLVLATVFFAFQIYCDFSGYSDIAIGAAQVMGFRLMDNFNRPYSSRSVSEFWKRWHISLSSWFRDYVYIPLGGNRVPAARRYLNLLAAFLLSGLWHGANWTFIAWGALNGLYVLIGIWTASARKRAVEAAGLARFPKLHRALQLAVTFSLVCFAWIFFRANDIHDALYISAHLLPLGGASWDAALMGQSGTEFVLAVTSIAFLVFVHRVQRHGSIRHMLLEKPVWFRAAAYAALPILILVIGKYSSNEFIYFQF